MTRNFVSVGPESIQIVTPNGGRFEDGLFVRSQVIDGSVKRTGDIKCRAYWLVVHLRSGTRHTFWMQSEVSAETAAQQVRDAVLKRPVEELVGDA